MLTLNGTTRSYSGKPGCMCGCIGTYNESERARKLAITQLLNDPRVKLTVWADGNEGCVYVVTATRNRALYLNEHGVSAAQQLGIEETV
jgi:hypothetical protein